jgi:RHS repeat-associated protein
MVKIYLGLRVSFQTLGEAENHVPPPPSTIYHPEGYCGQGVYYTTRLRVKLPDGSTQELRKDDVIYTRTQSPIDWTGTYLATDGSRSRLEMGETSSILYLPDGSRYHFQIPTGGTEQVGYMYEDRHGNRLNFNASTRTWTDTLGRSLTSPIPLYFGEPEQTAGTQPFTMPGLTGTSARQYSLVWKNLGDTGVLLDSNEALAYYGNSINCPYNNTETNALFFGSSETRICRRGIFNPVVQTEIILPNQQKYKFWYNKYGEITKIEYPTGAYERFAYDEVPTLARRRDIVQDQMNRGVTDRWVRESGSASELHWQYDAYKESNGVSGESRLRIRTTAPDTTTITDQYIETNWSNGLPQERTKYGFENPLAGRPYEERLYSGTTLKIRKLTEYEYTEEVGTGAFDGATRDARTKREISVIFEPGSTNALVSMTVNTYDTSGSTDLRAFSSLNLKTTSKYGFISVGVSDAQGENVSQLAARFNNSTSVVKTETDYAYGDSNYLDTNRNILGIVTEQRVINPANNNEVVSKSQMRYDEYSFETSGTLPTFANATWSDPSNAYRGNVTSVRSYTSVANSEYIETHSYFDKYGNLRKSVDANGNISQIEYNASDYAFAYPTKTISPVPGGNGSTTAFEATSTYDYNTGLALSTTDANGLVTKMEYNDSLLRPTKVKPTLNNVTVGAETITEYGAGTSDSTRFVKVKTQIDETNWKEGYTWYDGLGRNARTQSVNSADGDVFTLTCYDTMGRVKKVTNPFKNYTNQTCSTTTGLEWTTTDYDDFGRAWKMKTPDNAEVETTYGLATTGSLYGTVVTVEDQAGKLRRSVTNALGQLKRVDEPNDSNQLGAIDNPNQYTAYSYDTLNKLITVNQGTQTRTFVYDSISRLKEATNPESGTLKYTYDYNGNLKTRRDARDIKTIYDYDALNRVIKRCYKVLSSSSLGSTTCASNNETPETNTPEVTYSYDDTNVSYSKGKLTKVITGNISSPFSKTEYIEFDILGRIKKSKQTTDGTAYNEMEYVYNLSGALIEQKYPSGRVVKNILDNDGELSIVQSKKNQNAGFWNYAQHFTYTAAGAVSSMQLGNGHWESTQFNNRLQTTQITLGSTQSATDKLKLDYTYNTTNNADNNGNVLSQTITVPTETRNNTTYSGFTATQTYAYDSLNRIKDAKEMIGSTQQWKQTFTYDRYGNRSLDESGSSGNYLTTTLARGCSTSTYNPNGICDKKKVNPTFVAGNNRITQDQDGDSQNDYLFDAAGSTTTDANGNTFIYDGENKQVEVKNSSNQTVGQYWYDGDGKRVKKYVFSTGETTIFVYDASGKMVAEYSTIVESTSTAKVSYLTNDHLGSPRTNTDKNGNMTARHDYQPFGEEIQRASYGNDDVRKQFTGYERDDETSLDYAKARMFVSLHGRFTSPDPLLSSGRAENPQTWNRYVYVLNNPMKFTDPTGLSEQGGSGIKHPASHLVKIDKHDVITVEIKERVSPEIDPVSKEQGIETLTFEGDDEEGKPKTTQVRYRKYEIVTTLTNKEGRQLDESEFSVKTEVRNKENTATVATYNTNSNVVVEETPSGETPDNYRQALVEVGGEKKSIPYTIVTIGNGINVVTGSDNTMRIPRPTEFKSVPVNNRPDPIVESMRPKLKR